MGTSEELLIVISFVSVFPINSDEKSIASWLIVIKGYFPIALTFNVRVSSYPLEMSTSLITNSETSTFASSVLKVNMISYFLLG